MTHEQKSIQRQQLILNGSIWKTLMVLSAPLTFAFFLDALFQLVDLLYVSQLGSEHIAAMSLNMITGHFLYAMAIGPAIGLSSYVARKIGSNEISSATEAANNGITLALIISVLLTVTGLVFGKQILAILGGRGYVLELAWKYLFIRLVSTAFITMRIIVAGILRGEGDMKTAMYVLLVATVTNIILDPILIFGFWFIPPFGIQGAAMATAAADILGTVWLFNHLLQKKNIIKPDLKRIHLKLRVVFAIYRVGLPVALQNLAMVISFGFIARLVSSYSHYALAAAGIGTRLEMLAIVPIIAVSTSILTVVGQNYGAKNYHRVKLTAYAGSTINAFIGLIIGSSFFFFPEFFIRLFNGNDEILKVGVTFLKIFGFVYILSGVGISLAHVFHGLGKGFISLTLTLTRVGLVGVPSAYFLSGYWGLNGIWLGMASGSFFAVLLAFILTTYFFTKKINAEKTEPLNLNSAG